MKDIIANLKSSIVYSKKPGNEGQSLANAKGIYRPVAEVLKPAVDTLDAVELMLAGLREVAANTKALDLRMAILNEIATFEANLNPSLNAANNAKRGLK